jgi:hypothetical protein
VLESQNRVSRVIRLSVRQCWLTSSRYHRHQSTTQTIAILLQTNRQADLSNVRIKISLNILKQDLKSQEFLGNLSVIVTLPDNRRYLSACEELNKWPKSRRKFFADVSHYKAESHPENVYARRLPHIENQANHKGRNFERSSLLTSAYHFSY